MNSWVAILTFKKRSALRKPMWVVQTSITAPAQCKNWQRHKKYCHGASPSYSSVMRWYKSKHLLRVFERFVQVFVFTHLTVCFTVCLTVCLNILYVTQPLAMLYLHFRSNKVNLGFFANSDCFIWKISHVLEHHLRIFFRQTFDNNRRLKSAYKGVWRLKTWKWYSTDQFFLWEIIKLDLKRFLENLRVIVDPLILSIRCDFILRFFI